MYVAKTKALISFAVTAKMICVFVFAYVKCWFSHGAAQLWLSKDSFVQYICPKCLMKCNKSIFYYFVLKISFLCMILSRVVRNPAFGVSDQFRHKPGCTDTENSTRHEVLD